MFYPEDTKCDNCIYYSNNECTKKNKKRDIVHNPFNKFEIHVYCYSKKTKVI